MNPDRQYNTSFSTKGAILSDVKTALRRIDAGGKPEELRAAIIDEDLLDRGTRRNRESVWKEIRRRYISGRDAEHIATLARMTAQCPNSTAADLALFYEYCQADTLLYDLTAHCAYELYQNARTGIDSVDVNDWLGRQETEHPEIARWSPTTRSRIVRNYLATIRDFGLVVGIKQKEFHKLYLPREAFVYALYHQLDRGIEGKALVYAPDWRLFLLSEREVVFHLEDAANGAFIHFRHAGDIFDLRPAYGSLREVVHAITS